MDYSKIEQLMYGTGATRRDRDITAMKNKELRNVSNIISCKNVIINGEPRLLTMKSSTETDHVKIVALPDESLYAGDIIECKGRHFLVTDTYFDDDIHKSGNAYQCNIYLKWQRPDGSITGCYGYAVNISQFNSGIDSNKTLAVGELTLTVKVPCNEDTAALQRDKRFLEDVLLSSPEAIVLTGREVVCGNMCPTDFSSGTIDYKDKCITFTFSHSEKSDRDNIPLMIADYVEPTPPSVDYHIYAYKDLNVRCGGSYKTFILHDVDGEEVPDVMWTITTGPENEKYIQYNIEDNKLKVKALDNPEIVNSQIRIDAETTSGEVVTIYSKVVFLFG